MLFHVYGSNAVYQWIAMLQQDVLASDLYYGVWALKQKKKSACELQKEIVRG